MLFPLRVSKKKLKSPVKILAAAMAWRDLIPALKS
jgi:hypothetical protein